MDEVDTPVESLTPADDRGFKMVTITVPLADEIAGYVESAELLGEPAVTWQKFVCGLRQSQATTRDGHLVGNKRTALRWLMEQLDQ